MSGLSFSALIAFDEVVHTVRSIVDNCRGGLGNQALGNNVVSKTFDDTVREFVAAIDNVVVEPTDNLTEERATIKNRSIISNAIFPHKSAIAYSPFPLP